LTHTNEEEKKGEKTTDDVDDKDQPTGKEESKGVE